MVVKPPQVAVDESIAKWESSPVGQFLEKSLPFWLVKRTVDGLWGQFGKEDIEMGDYTQACSSPKHGFSHLTVQQVIEEALKSSTKLSFHSKKKGGSRLVGESLKGGKPIPPQPLLSI